MSTNLLKKVNEKKKKSPPPLFVPGCVKCHQVHMSLECVEPLMALELPKVAEKAEKLAKKERERADSNNNNGEQRSRNVTTARRGRGGQPRQSFQRPQQALPEEQMRPLMRPPRHNPSERYQSEFQSSPYVDLHSRFAFGERPNEQRSLLERRPNGRGFQRGGGFMGSSGFHDYGGGGGRGRGRGKVWTDVDRSLQFRPNRSSFQSHSMLRDPRAFVRSEKRQQPSFNPLRPIKHTLPPNEQHMKKLNDLLRPFSFGNEDMYEEVPMPLPTPPPSPSFLKMMSLASLSPPPPEPSPPPPPPVPSIPKLPENTMYIFRKKTILDESGALVDVTETASVVQIEGKELLFVDLGDDFDI